MAKIGDSTGMSVEERPGGEGMGKVVLADDTELERKAVLTFLPEALQTDSTARKAPTLLYRYYTLGRPRPKPPSSWSDFRAWQRARRVWKLSLSSLPPLLSGI